MKHKIDNGIKFFSVFCMLGLVFAATKLIDYLQWTIKLVKNWKLPQEPFFSKVSLINTEVQISITAYLIFAIAYSIFFFFILLGHYYLYKTTRLFDEERIFKLEVSLSFKKAGRAFLTYAFGTLIIDIVFLTWAYTYNRLNELLSTELLVFLILGFLMFFLAGVFKKGITLQEENDLTI